MRDGHSKPLIVWMSYSILLFASVDTWADPTPMRPLSADQPLYGWIVGQGWPESTYRYKNFCGTMKFPFDTDSTAKHVDLMPAFTKWGLDPRLQGKRDTCSVFTMVGSLEYALALKQGTGVRLSVEYLNWAANQATGKNQDGGFFSDLWRGFEIYGVCPEREMPYQAEFDPNLVPGEPVRTVARKLLENHFRRHWIKKWNVSTGLTESQLAAIKQTLRQQWPVCGGFRWPKNKVEWNEKSFDLPFPEEVFDGHSVLLIGYQDDPQQPGGGAFLFLNTNDGRKSWMTYAYAGSYMNDAMWIDCEK